MKTPTFEVGDTPALASTLSARLQDFLSPLLIRLDQAVDGRLVKTFAAMIELFLQQRYRASGLLLSELGAFLAGAEHAPAGTKRLSNLLRSPTTWTALLLEEWFWQQAERRLLDLVCQNQEALLLWDASVLEKPESTALEGLCPVRSSEAARLKRIKKGYTPPGGPPVFVPGMQWLCLLLMGLSPPVLSVQFQTAENVQFFNRC